MKSETIELQDPVLVDGTRIERLTMRAPKVRDMLAQDKAKGTDAEKEVRLFANLCEVAPAVVEELSLADYRRLQEAYTGFLSQD